MSFVCPIAANACLESTVLIDPLISTNCRAVAIAPEVTITKSYSFFNSTICLAKLSITANEILLVPAVRVEVPILIISFFFMKIFTQIVVFSVIIHQVKL